MWYFSIMMGTSAPHAFTCIVDAVERVFCEKERPYGVKLETGAL